MTQPIAYLTAGAGGMFCGSCIHDNTLARALIRRGIDVQLIPTYTPITTDEENVSSSEVFYGGVNVFLSQIVPFYKHLPSFAIRWLDHPSLIRWATNRASATSAASLGALTVSMLQGRDGNQRREVDQLIGWLQQMQPRLIVLSNVLIAGCVPELREQLGVPVLVTLQGDDVFLDSLPEPYCQQALAEIERLIPAVDGFLVNSRFYADRMGTMLKIPAEKLSQVPLGLDVEGYPAPGSRAESRSASPLTLGYLARISPEKGFHVLVDTFIELRRRGTLPNLQLRAAGWRGAQHRAYFEQQVAKLKAAGCEHDFHYAGSLTRAEKIHFLKQLDLFSVPTTYQEPKGLFVLESLASGVPVVLPAHGAFPELLEAVGGGQLAHPNDPVGLADACEELLLNHAQRRELGEAGRRTVHERYNADAMAAAVWDVWQTFLR